MGAILDLSKLDMWYRIEHPDFSQTKAYRAIAYIDYGESAWSQLLFINERGMTFSLRVQYTVCLNPLDFSRNLREDERGIEIPKSRAREGVIHI